MLIERSRKICGALGLWLGGLLVASGPIGAQAPSPPNDTTGAFVTLEVKGPLDDRNKALLDKLVESPSTSQLIEAVATEGAPLTVVCGRFNADKRCSNLGPALNAAKQDANGLSAAHWADARTFTHVGSTVSTTALSPLSDQATKGITFVIKPTEYLVFASQDPIVQASGRAVNEQPIAVSQDALRAAGITLAPPPVSGQESIAIIEEDLRVAPTTQRNFRINRFLPESQVRELIQSLNEHGSGTISVVRATLPKSSFSLIQFQNTNASCTTTQPNWPFDVARVKKIMEFNATVRQRLKLGAPRRARILVVDTGLGKPLAQSELFNKFLYADATELISPAAFQRDFNEPRCTDANDNGYWRDVYGTGSGTAASDDRRCFSSAITAFDLVEPYPKRPSSQQNYNPDHGSFVGGLAAGGPHLIAAFPQLSDYIGLSFFRVPQKSDVPELDIVNEFADITKSIDYAGKIEADVINMSLKTDRDDPFKAISQNATALLVAAAGNDKEDLDQHAAENFPASMSMPDRMIVVAALQPGTQAPFWPASAFSPSRVHIAAPGATIASYNSAGEEICDSGTSAAAPLVSFVAATIKSLTGAPRTTIRARILAAADHIEALNGKVEEGRRLNVEAALDVFVDRIEFKDGKLLTGWIEPDRSDPLVRVCKDASGSLDPLRGQIDLALLWEWHRGPDDKIALRYNRSLSEPFAAGSCEAPTGSLKFFDYEAKTSTDIQWSKVQKILPTPFRSVKYFIVN